MRILSVGDYDWMTGAERAAVRLSLFAIRRKLALAATRAGHLVVEFSDRAVARNAAPLRLKGLGGGWANRRFLQCVDELRPDLILLHFADSITNASLARGPPPDPGRPHRRHQHRPDRHRQEPAAAGAARRGFVDALFVTTAEPALGRYVGQGAFAAFMPNPVDRAVETGRAFEVAAPPIRPAAARHRRRAARGRRANASPPPAALARLRRRLPALRVHSPGVAGEPLAFGAPI